MSKSKQPLQPDPDHCFYCEEPITPINRTRDHLVPRAQRGSLENDNVVYACWDCNSLKGNRTPYQFMKAMELLRTDAARDLKKKMHRCNKIVDNIKRYLNAAEKQK